MLLEASLGIIYAPRGKMYEFNASIQNFEKQLSLQKLPGPFSSPLSFNATPRPPLLIKLPLFNSPFSLRF